MAWHNVSYYEIKTYLFPFGGEVLINCVKYLKPQMSWSLLVS